ncbi:hypothetical protein Pmar_PMAR029243 [Perkinsus marinus ATCC 50983]|uniref:Uncharacterized protein n=1 Tax=Perkinsus marinus (strain ATCC 50983 / TXsc) TaxID=423536 RepID=C5KMM1_PERM5|nr:hypothetical protein Pmar_PMAR029243 [Perkinsus marinus ATCC 50983]EER14179.1 hypothetical protein Pmar_PMAR029243 [Perkinsus marinus ATCC 50983]|eukprot:XP_002782384.1 hypothetical protein Pmar_PMAR029243 [Perkinsus marinus ATCC 50983]
MGQLSPTLGPDICSQYIVAQLNSLTEERSPKIRRTVAAAMAEVAAVVGPSLTLSKLYPFYVQLTHDSHWAVRKSAIDSMHLFLIELVKGDDERNASPRDSAVSELLSAMAAALVTDTSWWVRKSAMLKVGYVIASCGPCTSHSSIFNSVEPLLVQFADFILSHASNLSQMSSRESSRSSKGTYNNNTSGESLGGAELSREVLYHCSFTFAGVARSAFSSGVEFGPIWSQRLQKPFLSLLHCSESKVRRPLIASVHVLVSTCGKHCEEVFEDCALAVVQILASPQAGPPHLPKALLSSTQKSHTADPDDVGLIPVGDYFSGQPLSKPVIAIESSYRHHGMEGETRASESCWKVGLAAASSAPQLFRCRRVGPEMKHRIVAYLVKTYACSECYSRRRVLVEVAKEVLLSSRSGGVRDEGSLRSEARYFLTLLALLGLDDCVHIRLAVVSTLHLLNPLPAHPPESIETLIETLRQDDDREASSSVRLEGRPLLTGGPTPNMKTFRLHLLATTASIGFSMAMT